MNFKEKLLISVASPKVLYQRILLQDKLTQYQRVTKEYLNTEYGVSESQKYYHYTSLDNCLSIINSGNIWYNHYLNIGSDVDEVVKPYEISKKIVQAMARNSPHQYFWRELCEVFCDSKFLDLFSFYILSLSTERDEEDLWGFKEGIDCMIGFNPSYSNILDVSAMDNKSNNLLTIIVPVNYDEEKFSASINFFVNEAELILNNTGLELLPSLQFYLNLGSELMSNMLTLFPSFIKSSFQPEKEMRRFIMEFQARGEFYPRKIPEGRKCRIEGKKKEILISDLEPGDIAEIILSRDVDETSRQIIKAYGETYRIEINPSKYCQK